MCWELEEGYLHADTNKAFMESDNHGRFFFFQSSIPQHLSALTSVNALDSHIAASTGVRGFFKGAVMTWEWKPPGDV